MLCVCNNCFIKLALPSVQGYVLFPKGDYFHSCLHIFLSVQYGRGEFIDNCLLQKILFSAYSVEATVCLGKTNICRKCEREQEVCKINGNLNIVLGQGMCLSLRLFISTSAP